MSSRKANEISVDTWNKDGEVQAKSGGEPWQCQTSPARRAATEGEKWEPATSRNGLVRDLSSDVPEMSSQEGRQLARRPS